MKFGYNELKKYLESVMHENVPKNITSAFLSRIENENDMEPNYTVNTIEENGMVKIEVLYNNFHDDIKTEKKYQIIINNNDFQYTLNSHKINSQQGRTGMEITDYRASTTKLEYGEQGYKLTETEKKTLASRNNEQQNLDLSDVETETRKNYNDLGVEIMSDNKVSYYPTRKNQFQFTYGLPTGITLNKPEKTYVNTYVRTSLGTVEKYNTTYDMFGREIERTEALMNLDTEKNLMDMNVIPYASYNQEEYKQKKQYYENLDEMQLEEILRYTPEGERLISTYYPELSKSQGPKR